MFGKLCCAKNLLGIPAYGRECLRWVAYDKRVMMDGSPAKSVEYANGSAVGQLVEHPKSLDGSQQMPRSRSIMKAAAKRRDETLYRLKGLGDRMYHITWPEGEVYANSMHTSRDNATESNELERNWKYARMQGNAAFKKDARFDDIFYQPKNLEERNYQKTWCDFKNEVEQQTQRENKKQDSNKYGNINFIKASGNKSKLVDSYEQELSRRRKFLEYKMSDKFQIARLDEALYKQTPLKERDYQITWNEFEEGQEASTIKRKQEREDFYKEEQSNLNADLDVTIRKPADRPLTARPVFNKGMHTGITSKSINNYMEMPKKQVKLLTETMDESHMYGQQ